MEQRDGDWKKIKRNCEKVVKREEGPGMNCESRGRGLHEEMVTITEIKGGNWELGNRMGIRTSK